MNYGPYGGYGPYGAVMEIYEKFMVLWGLMKIYEKFMVYGHGPEHGRA
jgi:hypothetical protein